MLPPIDIYNGFLAFNVKQAMVEEKKIEIVPGANVVATASI
jgi:hypothetical protein